MMAGKRRGTREYSGGRRRGKAVQKEDAASMIQRTGEEVKETRQTERKGRRRWEEWKKMEGGFG